jgi:nucleotide-binding universal stress UspA family protein
VDDDPLTFDPPIEGGVVAGWDGTGTGRAVLDWAATEAAAHGEPLHVVRAWRVTEAVPDVGAPFGIVPSLAECRAVIADAARAAADAAVVRAGGREVTVHVHAVYAQPDVALEAASQRARIVVIGHRGRGVLHLVLGSVTEHLLGHTACPVAVIGIDDPHRG